MYNYKQSKLTKDQPATGDVRRWGSPKTIKGVPKNEISVVQRPTRENFSFEKLKNFVYFFVFLYYCIFVFLFISFIFDFLIFKFFICLFLCFI